VRLCIPTGTPYPPGLVDRALPAAQGSYTLTGQVAGLNYAPASGGFVMPNASNTGDLSGITRTAYTGSTGISGTTNLTITNKNITQSLVKSGTGTLIVRNCRLTFSGGYACIDGDANNGLIIVEDCDIVGTSGLNNGLAGKNFQIRRCNISGYENGFNGQDGAHQIISNYIHDLGPPNVGSAHVDCIQIIPDTRTGNVGMVIQGNALYTWDTSCILFQSLNTNIDSDTLIDNNWFLPQPGRGGGSYQIYVEDKAGHYNHGTRVTNNHFSSTGFAGYASFGDTGNVNTNTSVWSGNVTYPAGAPLPASAV
jgi:hypothetical protein